MKKSIIVRFLIIFSVFMQALSYGSSKIDKNKDRIKQINTQVKQNSNKIKSNKSKIEKSKSDEKNIKKQIDTLNNSIYLLQKEHDKLESKYNLILKNISKNEKEIKSSINKINQSNNNIDYKIEQYSNRIKALDIIRRSNMVKNTFNFETTKQAKRKQDAKKVLDLQQTNIESIKFYKKTVETNKKDIEKIKLKNLNEVSRIRRAKKELVEKKKELNYAKYLKDRKVKQLKKIQENLGNQNKDISKSNVLLIRERNRLNAEIQKIILREQKQEKKNKIIVIKGTGALKMPLKGPIVTVFGQEKVKGIKSSGIEIAGTYGQFVTASDTGTIMYTGNLGSISGIVIINHGKLITVYGNLATIKVKKGQKIKKGQTIGTLGIDSATGKSALYFETRKGVNSVDPLNYL